MTRKPSGQPRGCKVQVFTPDGDGYLVYELPWVHEEPSVAESNARAHLERNPSEGRAVGIVESGTPGPRSFRITREKFEAMERRR